MKPGLALHVVVERVPICQSDLTGDVRSRIEWDRVTLVPPHIRFSDLVQVILAKSGYLDDLPFARGKIG